MTDCELKCVWGAESSARNNRVEAISLWESMCECVSSETLHLRTVTPGDRRAIRIESVVSYYPRLLQKVMKCGADCFSAPPYVIFGVLNIAPHSFSVRLS